MNFLTTAGIAWGVLYFAWGSLSSFTLNSIDFWKSVTLLFSIFLLPLPIALLAIWFPSGAGKALVACMVITCVAAAFAIESHHEYRLADVGTFIAHLAAYNLRRLGFALPYIRTSSPAIHPSPRGGGG